MITETLSFKPDDISRAADILRNGGRVAFATETVYGLGADARNNLAVAGIFVAKQRPQFNPLIVHLADTAAAGEIAEMPETARKLAAAFWPGPMTLVLPRRANSGLSDLVSAGLDSIALRVPAHPLAQALLRAAAIPVAAPSANPSGKISPTQAAHVIEGLGGRIEAVLDGGTCPVGLESTILGFEGESVILLRAGGLPNEAISALLNQPLHMPESAKITAPGQMKSHYAPDALLRLNADFARPEEIMLGFGAITGRLNLSPSGDLHEAAANLFACLREMDRLAGIEGKKIAVAKVPPTGLGLAINDRLSRAAAPRP